MLAAKGHKGRKRGWHFDGDPIDTIFSLMGGDDGLGFTRRREGRGGGRRAVEYAMTVDHEIHQIYETTSWGAELRVES
jgi:hypothetical protein